MSSSGAGATAAAASAAAAQASAAAAAAAAAAAVILPSQAGAGGKYLATDGTNPSWRYNEGPRAVVDFRKLPDGAASTIQATEGKFVAFKTTDDTKFSVSGGRLVVAASAPVVYMEVQCDDTVQHAWAVVEFDTLANQVNNAGILIGLPNPPSWFSTPTSMGIHSQIFGKVSGAAVGTLSPGTYNTTGTKSPTQVNLPYTLVSRTVRYEITMDKANGQVRYFIDGVCVATYTDLAVLTYVRKTALLETSNSGIKVVEFGASSVLPVAMEQTRPWIAPNSFVSGSGAITASSGTNGGGGGNSAGAVAADWKLITTVPVVYDHTGCVEVYWNPYLLCTTGTVFFDLGPSTGGPDGQSPSDGTLNTYYRTKVCEATTKARVFVSLLRRGTPGTVETVGIYAVVSTGGAATFADNTYSGTGPRVRSVNPINYVQNI